jgi:hypothetical protein
MALLLWILSIILLIAGIVQLVQGQIIFGALLIIGALLLGGGGVGVPYYGRRRPV